MRQDGRLPEKVRRATITRGASKYAEGSALIEVGNTRVLCTASVDKSVPPFLIGSGQGWVTAEYAMLPRATTTRTSRERSRGGRSQEIQRLIGRSLRAVVDLSALGERSVTLDCDVLQADGGTRTAAVTGAFVALAESLAWLRDRGELRVAPLLDTVAAVSVGLVDGQPLVDLCYAEDYGAEVDMNVVLTGGGRFVEVQGTGEERSFTEEELGSMLKLARIGIGELTRIQRDALGPVLAGVMVGEAGA